MTPFAISAIIFDFDGTILDTEWTQFTTVQEEFRNHGHDYQLADFQRTVGRADHRHWSDLLQDLTGPLANIEEVKERRMAAHHALIATAEIRDGVKSLLDRADDQGMALAVASSSPSSWVEGHLSRRGLLSRFQYVATRDHVERAKPWPDVFQVAAGQIDIDPASCLVIEDSANGVAAAKAAGMVCVAVPNTVTASSDLSQADLVIDSLDGLPYDLFNLE